MVEAPGYWESLAFPQALRSLCGGRTTFAGLPDIGDRRLKECFGQHPFVGDIRGRGLFWALELVSDRASKQPFDPAAKLHARVKREAMDRGLMVYPMGGTVDGVNGDHVLLAPPFIVEGSQVDAIAERLAGSLDAALADIR